MAKFFHFFAPFCLVLFSLRLFIGKYVVVTQFFVAVFSTTNLFVNGFFRSLQLTFITVFQCVFIPLFSISLFIGICSTQCLNLRLYLPKMSSVLNFFSNSNAFTAFSDSVNSIKQ